MNNQHMRAWIIAAVAAGLLAGCSQNNSTAKDDNSTKATTAQSSAPYNPADQSKAPAQFGNRASGSTLLHYGTGQSTPPSQ